MVKGFTLTGSQQQGGLAGTKIDDQVFLTRADELTKWARSYRVARLMKSIGIRGGGPWAPP